MQSSDPGPSTSAGSQPSSGRQFLSFSDYQKKKGTEWKGKVTKSAAKKGSNNDGNRDDQEVAIFIGLMEWCWKSAGLKTRRGKRLALKVPKNATHSIIKEKAVQKWKAYYGNLYDDAQEYVLLLDNFQEALFLPGSKEFFSLKVYQEELGKDFKRITMYLCTSEDFKSSEGLVESDNHEPEESVQVHKRRKTEFPPQDADLAATMCHICLERISDTDKEASPACCSDRFHEVCLEEWFKTSTKCPQCSEVFLTIRKYVFSISKKIIDCLYSCMYSTRVFLGCKEGSG